MEIAKDDSYRRSLWPAPPRTLNASGDPRRIGVELEFSGMEIEDIARITARCLGGRIEQISSYEISVRDSILGDIGVELDYAYLKKLGRERDPHAEVDDLDQLGESLLKLAAEQLVPHEIVSAPMAMADAWRLGELLQRLRAGGARGTGYAVSYAFGLHLNPELPDTEPATIVAYLRAFLCLFEWLRERSKVDLSRRVTPYIDPFEKEYVLLVLDKNYAPDLSTLIDDYLLHNPTRNRALDMLPLFSHLDEPRVRNAIDDDRIKARPTFHYRLPNCDIDNPDWSLAQPWRDWLQIEALACDPRRLEAARRGYLQHLRGPAGGLFHDWVRASSRWLLPELL